MSIEPPKSLLMNPLKIREKLLMGPGPSNCSENVLKIMSEQVLGHLHPETLKIMDEIKDGLRYIFQTNNDLIFCVSASGHGAMETALCNLLEPGDILLIGVTGIWGYRAAEMAKRYGADVRFVNAKPGTPLLYTEIEVAIKFHKPKVFFIVQGDSSTGVLQNITNLGDLCHRYNCLLIVDTVASLGGTELYTDKWSLDVVYTGSQKVIGAPAGITPIVFSSRATEVIRARRTSVNVYYFDALLLGEYWGCFKEGPRIYHHTVSATLLYGLREALRNICIEGLPTLIKRHNDCSMYLQEEIQKLGLKMYVNEFKSRLSTVNAIIVPDNINWTDVALYSNKHYALEISGGLGPTAGLIFRIGLMGNNANKHNIDLLIKILRESIKYAVIEKIKEKKSKI